ncbi:MAG: GDP-mannose 4,6-dehydratase [Patescibacteria group bacterium]|nr:GDP-mannose 4,6-dehydratase [Patescibacteria group bacterium]
MKILITGGAGFIGSHLADKLIKRSHQVVVVDNLSTGKKKNLNPAFFKKSGAGPKAKFYKIDICDSKISQIFEKEKPDIVFHFAAQIDVRKSVENPIENAKINILGSLNLIQNFIQSKIFEHSNNSNNSNIKFVFASSGGAIYGDTDVIPTPETHPENPESPYGIAKLAIEKYLHFYKNTYGLDYVVLRYSNIYGPRQNSKGETGVVAIFCHKLLRGEQPVINGDGKQTRDYLYVEDAVEAAILALKTSRDRISGSSASVYNVGTGIETSVNELYELLAKEMGKDISPKYGPSKKGEQLRSCLDYSKIKKELGWQPKYSLEEGLKETIKWFSHQKK